MKPLKSILFLIVASLWSISVRGEERSYTFPREVMHVQKSSILLNGAWEFRFTADSEWTTVQVPGEVAMQGYGIRHDVPFYYRKKFTIPADYEGQTILLRFDGVYSYASLSVNGQVVREHRGGFTRWEADVTAFVTPGKINEILLEVMDCQDEISYASGYAHHPIGGILRDVTLFALPPTYLYDLRTETQWDAAYKNAVLKIMFHGSIPEDTEVEYKLQDQEGKNIWREPKLFVLKKSQGTLFTHEIGVAEPLQWDAEHPNLYDLQVTIRQNGNDLYQFNRRIGFREVKVKGSELYVNGSPVKLRGACRHDIHPTLGRATTAEIDSLDALLFKRANMNFVRTSHYPPSERFLEYCDQLGIYVECETAVCFVNNNRQKNYAPGGTQDDPAYTQQYVSQCEEMVKSFYTHPSVIMWSIANESVYGSNFQVCWDWVKEYDQTRPVLFSYPGTVKKEDKIYDILSMHYPDVWGNKWEKEKVVRGFRSEEEIPVLYDEWAHPACYTYQTLQEDPNIREFWGQSLEMMWTNLFYSESGLGGAIWGYVDEIFMLPEPIAGTSYWKEFAHTAKPEGVRGNCVGYGEWGIVDIWRREKPEYWATKKAYSPVKLLSTQIWDFVAGESIQIPVHNRFDHSDLKEVKIKYLYKGIEKELPPVSLAPHRKGFLTIPAEAWETGEKITISSYTIEDQLIDTEQILLGEEVICFPQPQHNGTLQVTETKERLIVKGSTFEIPFNKETGLIENAVSRGKVFIEKGPFLHMDLNWNYLTDPVLVEKAKKFVLDEDTWQKKDLVWKKDKRNVAVTIIGSYGKIDVCMTICISPTGQFVVDYVVEREPNGVFREVGLQFHLPDQYDHLVWKRKGTWSYYPEDAFAGNEGTVSFYNAGQAAYGEVPVISWREDTHNYYYWGDTGANSSKPLTQCAKGMKEHIWYYSLSDSQQERFGLSVVSTDASLACRVNRQNNEQLVLYINNMWDYPEIGWGNYIRYEPVKPWYGNMKIVF